MPGDQDEDLRSLAVRLVSENQSHKPGDFADAYETEAVTDLTYESLQSIQGSTAPCLTGIRALLQAYRSTAAGKQKADDAVQSLRPLSEAVTDFERAQGLANQQYLEPAELFSKIGTMESYAQLNSCLNSIADRSATADEKEENETNDADHATAVTAFRLARCQELRIKFPEIVQSLELYRTLEEGEEENDKAMQALRDEADDFVVIADLDQAEEEDNPYYAAMLRAGERSVHAKKRQAREDFRRSYGGADSASTGNAATSQGSAGGN